jgi:hypothetical protein
MHELVFGTVATGEGAFHPGRDFTPGSDGQGGLDEQADNASGRSQSVPPDVRAVEEEPTVRYSCSPQLFFLMTDILVQDASAPLGPITPWKVDGNRRKRAAEDDFESASSVKRSRGRKPTAGHAMTDVASSVRELATAFVGSMGSTATPERKAAIRQLEDDADLSEDEQIQAFRLFRKDSAVAQSYLSISKKATRTRYIQSELAAAT